VLDLKQERLPVRASVRRPASLLIAKHRVVPFEDVHGLRAEFVQWATGVPTHALGSPALARLVHAAAGLGKTRALIEIADQLNRAHGWLAGFVPRDVRGAGRELSERTLERLILEGRDARGLMLIVDYAESRQDDVVWLADRLVRRVETNSSPARLVLLSRRRGSMAPVRAFSQDTLPTRSGPISDIMSGMCTKTDIEIGADGRRVSKDFDRGSVRLPTNPHVIIRSPGDHNATRACARIGSFIARIGSFIRCLDPLAWSGCAF
jgi:hypothetical protein